MAGLDALAAMLHETAKEKGFWDGEYSHDKIGNKLALVHSEVTEVVISLLDVLNTVISVVLEESHCN